MMFEPGLRHLTGLFILLAGFVLAAGISAPASAHGRSTQAGPSTGISIPGLTHGQMAVMAENRGAIMDLASRQVLTDPVMRRLETYINLQSFVCGWGIVPGGVTDETSSFNECSHAYLAATRALLLHLRTMPGNEVGASGIIQKIELEMLENGASLVLCRYGDEPFNTANVINPHVGPVPLDPISLALMMAGTMLCGWLAILLHRNGVIARRR